MRKRERRRSPIDRSPVRSLRAQLRVEQLEERNLLNGTALADTTPPDLLVRYRGAEPDAWQAVPIPVGLSLEQALARYRADPNVLAVEPDQVVQADVIPNDPLFGQLWGLNNTGQYKGKIGDDIKAPAAWDVTTGSTKNVVAVIDTGIDYRHVDLYQNIWINQGEVPATIRSKLTDIDGDGLITFRDLNNPINQGPGKITDLNGNGYIDGGDLLKPVSQGGWADGISNDGDKYVDDIIGWDFANNDNNPLDDNNHGTHVSGILGASGNNAVGVVGVDWDVQLMAVKFLNSSGTGSLSAAIDALNYAVSHGAVISNNSWGGFGYSQALFDAIDAARGKGHLFVTSAGNGQNSTGVDIDAQPSYPASLNLGNVVTVAATTREGYLATFSNYGATSVDLGAPGLSIVSTTRNNTYSNFSGTSMAAPYVAGVLALVKAEHPDWHYYRVINQVLQTVDPLKALSGKTVTGGQVNAYRAVTTVLPDVTGPHVVSAVPNASATKPVSSLRVTFSEGIDPSTFTLADIASFTGPNGNLTVTRVSPIFNTDDRQFDLFFTQQSTAGTYTLTLGPDLRDWSGNPMDQNGNGTAGEVPQDRFTAKFVIQPTYTFTNSTAVPIRDLSKAVSSITVNQDLTIGAVRVQLNLSHTFDNDLYIHLTGPDGTDVMLVYRRGLSGDNFTNTILDDTATKFIGNGSAPFTGSFRPEQPLSAFAAKNARGTWQLWVEDQQAGDSGKINSWSLIIDAGASATAAALSDPDVVEQREEGGTVRAASLAPAEEPEALVLSAPTPAAFSAATREPDASDAISPAWALVPTESTHSAQAVVSPSAKAPADRVAQEASRGETNSRPARAAIDLLFASARSVAEHRSLFALGTSLADADLIDFFANGL
ncbi:MAG: S8 family serine peptidase [Planctomycetes bacterium]|nr:S8 family serine peptidase [Planctomycetota bacterium]